MELSRPPSQPVEALTDGADQASRAPTAVTLGDEEAACSCVNLPAQHDAGSHLHRASVCLTGMHVGMCDEITSSQEQQTGPPEAVHVVLVLRVCALLAYGLQASCTQEHTVAVPRAMSRKGLPEMK